MTSGDALDQMVGVRIPVPQSESEEGEQGRRVASPLSSSVSEKDMQKPATLIDWIAAPDWVTVVDAARLTGYHISTLDGLIETGAVEAKESGGKTLIETKTLREFTELAYELRTAND